MLEIKGSLCNYAPNVVDRPDVMKFNIYLSSFGCTWELWRAIRKLEFLMAILLINKLLFCFQVCFPDFLCMGSMMDVC